MQYLVQMKLVPQGRPMNAGAGVSFFEEFIRPTLELGKKLHDENKILAGGPISGAIGLAMIVQSESAKELDDLLTSLPVWPLMEVDVTPLTTFEDRGQSIRRRLSEEPPNHVRQS
jgi:muconolactone delta-isomerase